MRAILTAIVAAALLAPPAGAADLFRYETESGTLSYTDDVKRIPSRYRDQAVREAPRSLSTYPRLTVVDSPPEAPAEAPAERDPFAALAEALARFAPAAPGDASAVQVPVGESFSFQAPAAGEEPVRVRRNQWREVDDGSLTYYKPFTVIEQGDRVIAEIEPH